MANTIREISAVKDQQMKEAAEKSGRSVFVGNIPYEATDDELKEIFSQAGPVLSFRLVYDRETGKPKGYGFCEYKDMETAHSAMRNLNGTELHGRQLRVDSAASQKGANDDPRAYMKEISPYGAPVPPDRAPETITSAVASLPPEQMFELMKQMKLCIQNNPEEARQMLLQNPQLAYALLQAQVIMKIVDPKVANAILHQPRGEPLPIKQLMEQAGIGPAPGGGLGPGSGLGGPPGPIPGPPGPPGPPPGPPGMMGGPPGGLPPPDVWRGDVVPPPKDMGRGPPPPGDMFPVDDRLGPPIVPPHEMREFRGPPMEPDDRIRGMPPPVEYRGPRPPDDRYREPMGPPGGPGPYGGRPPPERGPPMDHMEHRNRMEMEMRGGMPPYDDRMGRDERMRDPRGPPRDQRGVSPHDMRGAPPPDLRDPRGPPPPDTRDPRYRPPPVGPPGGHPAGPGGAGMSHGGPGPLPPSSQYGPPSSQYGPPNAQMDPRSGGMPPRLPLGLAGLAGPTGPGGPSEEEKARLIMQVMNLTEDQIRILPEDQRESILLLKSQIAKSQQR